MTSANVKSRYTKPERISKKAHINLGTMSGKDIIKKYRFEMEMGEIGRDRENQYSMSVYCTEY